MSSDTRQKLPFRPAARAQAHERGATGRPRRRARGRRRPGLRGRSGWSAARGRSHWHQRPHDQRRGDHGLARRQGRSAPLGRRRGRPRWRGAVGRSRRPARAGGAEPSASGLAAAVPVSAAPSVSAGPMGAARSGRAAVISARRMGPRGRRRTSGPGAIWHPSASPGSGPHGLGCDHGIRCQQRSSPGLGSVSRGADGAGGRTTGDGEAAAGRRSHGSVRDDGFCL